MTLDAPAPRLDEAREAVCGIEHPREAWEALAARGLVPESWVDDPRRWFVCSADEWLAHGSLAAPREGPLASPHPPSTGACVALAADPRGVATAETLAHEVAREEARRGDAPRWTGAIYWRVVDEAEALALRGLLANDEPRGEAERRLRATGYLLDPTAGAVLVLLAAPRA